MQKKKSCSKLIRTIIIMLSSNWMRRGRGWLAIANSTAKCFDLKCSEHDDWSVCM